MDGMWTVDQELIQDFLMESEENLARMDRDLVALSAQPQDERLLGSIFRTIHTIKGASGLLEFHQLEAISLPAEILLGQVRDGKRPLDQALTALTTETMAAIRGVLAGIGANGQEGAAQHDDLIRRLREAGAQA